MKTLKILEEKDEELSRQVTEFKEKLEQLEKDRKRLQKPIEKLFKQKMSLEEVTKLTGEDKAGDLKLVRQRYEKLLKDAQNMDLEINEIQDKIITLEKMRPDYKQHYLIRKLILSNRDLWNLRAKALDEKLTEKERAQLGTLRVMVEKHGLHNTTRIYQRMEHGTWKGVEV